MKWYVDDVFVMFLCQAHLDNFVNYMNIKQPNIKFNLEFKINIYFYFLDVKVTRTNNQLATSVFQRQHLVVFLPTLEVLYLLHTSLA